MCVRIMEEVSVEDELYELYDDRTAYKAVRALQLTGQFMRIETDNLTPMTSF